jgi:glyoxylase-like metal-dependent hydrolase (beta-lactamase superfamily II)
MAPERPNYMTETDLSVATGTTLEETRSWYVWFRPSENTVDTESQLADLGLGDLPIIGGKQCEAVTRTPADRSTFKLGSISVKALYTPCHTQDSICWFMQDGDHKVVFTGDTLFIGGVSGLSVLKRSQTDL